MKIILIGGPRHRHQFKTDYTPMTWVVPDPEPVTSINPLVPISLDREPPSFATHTYLRGPRLPGGYVIYLSESL